MFFIMLPPSLIADVVVGWTLFVSRHSAPFDSAFFRLFRHYTATVFVYKLSFVPIALAYITDTATYVVVFRQPSQKLLGVQ